MRSRFGVVLAAALACSSLGAGSCASSGASSEGSTASGKKQKRAKGQVGAPMPSIVVKEMETRRKIDLGELRGKVVLVDIWASWCAPCKEEMPLLDEMATRLKKKGVEIIAVSVDEDKASAQEFLSSREEWSLTVAHDPKGKLPEVLKPAKMPSSYVMDSEGIIRYVNEGFERGDIKTLESRLSALAEEAS
jgi:thiol-disulfide isomerase/thioredoxin